MQEVKTNKTTFSYLSILLLLFMVWFLPNQSEPQYQLPAYYTANINYKNGNFEEALNGFYQALNQNPAVLNKDVLLPFKIGYALYRTGKWNLAIQVLEHNRTELKQVEDYLLYYRLVSYLQLGDTTRAGRLMETLRREYPESPWNDFTDSLQARIAFQRGQTDSALKYMKRMLRSGKFEKTDIYLKMIRILKNTGDVDGFHRSSYRFLSSYPFHNRSKSVFEDVKKSYNGKIPNTEFRALIDYLFTTRQFLTAEDLVSEQRGYAKTDSEKDYFNWLPVEIAYRQGEYRRVLDWCLKQRNHFQTPAIIRKVDLHVARCYLRLGQIDKSIRAYLEYQKRYSRNGLSAEVLWVVAWLYEKKGDIPEAIETYQRLISTYPYNSFRNEAYFRIGLGYYRMGHFEKARKKWQRALGAVRDRQQQARIWYWIGKSYEKEQDYQKQGKIYSRLAKRPIDSYYNMKAFYLTSDGQDTHKRIREIFWKLHYRQRGYLPRYINEFRRALLVKEMLGPRWSNYELQSLNYKLKDWQAVFALGELHEKTGNYGQAYRRFRSIFRAHFSESNLPDMIPVFKKLYPFYFKSIIDTVSRRFSVPKALILSVIKKESAFEPKIISYANAYGLMQLLPSTASQVAPKLGMRFTSTSQLFDSETNIRMGSYYLHTLLRRYQGNFIMALAAYNAGPHRVDRWKEIFSTDDDDLFMENLEFKQTRVYVRTCMKYLWVYRAIMNPGQIPEEIISYPVKFTQFIEQN